MTLNRYFTLGNTGLRVSPLALGAMTFGTEWGWGTNRETAEQMLSLYLERGGNFIDTADLYTGGTSEQWLGEMISERKLRDRVVLATKFSYNAEPGNPNAGGNGRKNLLRAVEGSLRRLKTDYIDLYLLHTWDGVTPVEEVMRTFDDLVRAGKVRHVGLSNTPAWYAARGQTLAEARGYERLSALQLEYSLVERHIEREFIPLGTELGMGVMVWSPLGSGMLSGKYRAKDGAAPSTEGRLQVMQDSTNPGFTKLKQERNWRIVAELEQVSDALGHSMAQVALNWVANRPGVASVLVGATKLSQLEDNLGALDFDIPTELRQRLDAVSALPQSFPYSFFEGEIQSMIHTADVARKPPRYLAR
ncbi:MAG: aldo/keto reductase [Polyangiaceae bacterium]|nr:aldo/keto reductase [Polyangiaceae bacterium]